MSSTTVVLKEPAGPLGDHLDLSSQCLIRELVEQKATRMAEAVLDMEDSLVDKNSLNLSIKRKSTDAKKT